MPSVSDVGKNGTLPGRRIHREDISVLDAGRSGKRKERKMEGTMKVMDRTPEGLAEAAKKMLKVGDKVKVKKYSTDSAGAFVVDRKGTRVGTVIEMSRWIFLVDFGGMRESFRYNQLFHGGSGDRVYLVGKEKPFR